MPLLDNSPMEIEPVRPAIQRQFWLPVPHFSRKIFHLAAAYVWGIGNHAMKKRTPVFDRLEDVSLVKADSFCYPVSFGIGAGNC